MSEATGRRRSAIVFGARNLGRAVIETLVAEGWAVAGVARSQATLAGVIAEAVLFLANQDARAATHELQLTPLAEAWTP